MTWTTYEDVANRWNAPTAFPVDESKVETLIDDAEGIILSEYPTIQDQIDNGSKQLSTVVRIVSWMVIRHLLNPTGLRTTSETRGPNQMSVTHGGDNPGSLYLTDEDRRALASSGQGKRKAFSINTTPAGAYSGQCDEDLWDRIQ